VRQVLINLLTNAAEAVQDDSPVRISARSDQGWIEIRVEDDGPGIAREVAGKLFAPLITTKPSGIGLGLALSKRLVQLNDGAIDFERGRSRGAAFTLRLPVRTASEG
jgi:two-component system sensor kinase FixL